MSVCAHLIAPDSPGLFHRANSQSGYCGWRRPTVAEEAATEGIAFVAAAGCSNATDTLACLREQPMATLVSASRSRVSVGGPVTDSVILPIQPLTAFTSGRFAQVPVIMGGTRDEGSIFVAMAHDLRGKPVTSEQYPALIGLAYGKKWAPSIIERYPLSKYSSPSQALSAVQTDGGMVCPIQLATRLLSAKTVVYAYEFNQRSAGGINFAPDVPSLDYGIPHGADVNYTFAGKAPKGVPLTAAETALSDQVIGYLTRFARSGDPNGSGATIWPRYEARTDAMLSFEGLSGSRPRRVKRINVRSGTRLRDPRACRSGVELPDGFNMIESSQASAANAGSDNSPELIPASHYICRDFLKREYEQLWPRTWQVACREEELADVGSYLTYEIGDQSLILVRTAPGTIRSYYNVCLHRGRRLKEGCGRTTKFHCSYHGWQWDLDGRNTRVLDREDWQGSPVVSDEQLRLRESLVDTWGGFVFVNMDLDASRCASTWIRCPDFWTALNSNACATAGTFRSRRPVTGRWASKRSARAITSPLRTRSGPRSSTT